MANGDKDDASTLVAIGAVAAVVASLAHEALGHGLGCVADGGRVTLLTFLVFRCQGAGVLADGGGPIGALAVGLASLGLLLAIRPKPTPTRMFLFTLAALTLFWPFAQMLREATDGSDDWGHVARDLAWPPAWHLIGVAVALAGYVATLVVTSRLARIMAAGRPTRLAALWGAAVIAGVVLAALWRKDAAVSALDGFMTFGVAQLGWLGALRAAGRAEQGPTLARSWPWIAGAAFIVVAAAATVGRGLGVLA